MTCLMKTHRMDPLAIAWHGTLVMARRMGRCQRMKDILLAEQPVGPAAQLRQVLTLLGWRLDPAGALLPLEADSPRPELHLWNGPDRQWHHEVRQAAT